MTFVIKVILEDQVGVCSYVSDYSIKPIFEKIKELLFYYNKNIASLWFHPTLRLLRFFQMQDKDCKDDSRTCASMDIPTSTMMSKWHLDNMSPKHTSLTEGMISLEKDGIKDSISTSSKIVTINLNTNTIDMIGCFKTISINDYLRRNNENEFSWKEVPEVPFELDNLRANEVDELWEFIKEHDGFKKQGYMLLLAPFAM